MLGLFLDLMKITVVIESMSITKLNVLQKENCLIEIIYYQQNEKPTEINPRKSWNRSLVTATTLGEMCY